jgi:hypothetical protein
MRRTDDERQLTDVRADELPLEGLVAVARWHREHERFHSMNALQDAADLRRDSNALKVLARRWLEIRDTEPASFPVTDPLFRAAGCEDLNDLGGVATTGVLFMEGESEPAELTQMKQKLAGMAAGLDHWSAWLAEKMEPAWERESVLLTTSLTSAAQPRFATLARTTRTGAALGLVARLLHTSVTAIAARPLVPQVVRDDPAGSAQRLLAASWLLDEASSVLAETAADLARSDPDWTAYLAALDDQPSEQARDDGTGS